MCYLKIFSYLHAQNLMFLLINIAVLSVSPKNVVFWYNFVTAPYVAVMYALLQLYSVNYCHIRFFCCTQYCIINFEFNP